MRRCISIFLALILLIACVLPGVPEVNAAKKADDTRAIAIVFDNSGSMYDVGDQAWCRATYAMEVFASMLNAGDILQIYPMNPITVGGKEYTMQSPLQITDAAQAASIREIYTKNASGTPIESIDCAATGLQGLQANKKFLIVLTDGGTFSKGSSGLTKERTKTELDKRVQAQAGPAVTVMYLGVGAEACMPGTAESDYFVKRQAVNSADVLATLTEMCNQAFGRDTLPKSHISGKTINVDLSISKLIVFVQGNNIADLKLTGGTIGQPVDARQIKFSTAGAGNYKSAPDESLQGMMVTYEDCEAGEYKIEFSGTESSVEVYYEPDVDLDFVFTDADGKTVDPNALYEGDYKVSYGMKDAKTGQLVDSDLLGKPHYEGCYYKNGTEYPFTYDGTSGAEQVKLSVNDTFDAKLTVKYLSGYTISKDSSDFGWPEGGIKVTAPPLGKFGMNLKAPQNYMLIKELDQSTPLVAELTIDGKKLTAEEFEAVKLQVDAGGIKHKLIPNAKDSSYQIQLQNTDGIGEKDYNIRVTADYLDIAGRADHAEDSQKVTLSNTPLWVKWLIGGLLFLLLLLLIILILRIRKMPSRVRPDMDGCSLHVGGKDVTPDANFYAKSSGKQIVAYVEYNAEEIGRVIINRLAPGKESYLYKPSHKRNFLVKFPESVTASGDITAVDVGTTAYVVNKEEKLVPDDEQQAPYTISNGASITMSGKTMIAGKDKKFYAEIPLNFRK